MSEINKSIEEIIQNIGRLTLPDLNNLITKLKEEYNLKEEIMVAQNVNSAPVQEEENKKVSLILKKVGTQSLQVYRIIGSKLGKSLLESKKLVESLPATILDNVDKSEVQELKSQLEVQGAEVEIK